MLVKLEYIWLDGYSPESNLRSKTKIWDFDPMPNTLNITPIKRKWSMSGRITYMVI